MSVACSDNIDRQKDRQKERKETWMDKSANRKSIGHCKFKKFVFVTLGILFSKFCFCGTSGKFQFETDSFFLPKYHWTLQVQLIILEIDVSKIEGCSKSNSKSERLPFCCLRFLHISCYFKIKKHSE